MPLLEKVHARNGVGRLHSSLRKIPPFYGLVIAKISPFLLSPRLSATPILQHPDFWAVSLVFQPVNQNTPLLVEY